VPPRGVFKFFHSFRTRGGATECRPDREQIVQPCTIQVETPGHKRNPVLRRADIRVKIGVERSRFAAG